MASTSDSPPVKRCILAETALVAVSLLLLLTAIIVLQQLMSNPVPNSGLVSILVPLAMVDASLVMLGSVASLVYVFVRQSRAWTAAVAMGQIAIVISILLAVQGNASLVSAPARGDFGGLANLAWLVVAVIIPALVALIALVALSCLIVIRPEPQERIAKWVKLQAIALVLLLIPAGLILVYGARHSPAARFQTRLQKIKSATASVPELIESLESPDQDSRFWALQELEKMGPRGSAAVPALAELLEDPVSGPEAAQALAAIGPQAEAAIPALVETIKRKQGIRFGTAADRPPVRSWVAGTALTAIGRASIPELITLLAHDDRFVRMTAVNALGNMGPQAKDAVPALNEALNDQDERVRQLARSALNRIEFRDPVIEGGPTVPEISNRVQETPSAEWTSQSPYADDLRNRPPGTVIVAFDDGYRWLITEIVVRWEQSIEGDRKIQTAITGTRRYEHVLGTHKVRIVDQIATPAAENTPSAPQGQKAVVDPGEDM